jgi:hypothetical protein
MILTVVLRMATRSPAHTDIIEPLGTAPKGQDKGDLRPLL